MIGGTQGKPIERRCPQEGADAMNASMKRARRLSEESFESLWVKSKPATIREARIYAGSIGEEMTIYSIVNTLTELPFVKKVKILVDGEELDTISGHVEIGGALSRRVY